MRHSVSLPPGWNYSGQGFRNDIRAGIDVAIHKPVLLNKVIEYLVLFPNGVYVDATIGTGGHAEAILDHAGPHARLIGIDRDREALAVCRKRLHRFRDRLTLFHGNFSEMPMWIRKAGEHAVHAILLDLGMSSLQLDDAQRGFSFTNPGPIDMRMDQQKTLKGEHVVNTFSIDRLASIFRNYGEEKFSQRIARAIVQARRINPIRLTSELADIIKRAVPGKFRHARKHPATRVFQSIRMEVNGEMQELDIALDGIAESLLVKGRMAVISFHSLEDRRVKGYIFNQSRGCVCPEHFPLCVCGKKPTLKKITKKPVMPDEAEIKINARARSARMRVAEKVA